MISRRDRASRSNGGRAAAAQAFHPKLLTTLREGYHADDFRRDVLAAITVAIVALPLSMAIAVAERQPTTIA